MAGSRQKFDATNSGVFYIFCDAWRSAAFRGPAVQDDD